MVVNKRVSELSPNPVESRLKFEPWKKRKRNVDSFPFFAFISSQQIQNRTSSAASSVAVGVRSSLLLPLQPEQIRETAVALLLLLRRTARAPSAAGEQQSRRDGRGRRPAREHRRRVGRGRRHQVRLLPRRQRPQRLLGGGGPVWRQPHRRGELQDWLRLQSGRADMPGKYIHSIPYCYLAASISF